MRTEILSKKVTSSEKYFILGMQKYLGKIVKTTKI